MKNYIIISLILTSNMVSVSENLWQPRAFIAHIKCKTCGESRPWTDTFCSNCMTNLRLKHVLEDLENLDAADLQLKVMSKTYAAIVSDSVDRESQQ